MFTIANEDLHLQVHVMYDAFINSFKPGVPFMGYRQNRIAPDVTPQNAAPHPGLFYSIAWRIFIEKLHKI